ncbi:hypothetical protein MRX96_036432 [Rhipicephalus microplus]
MSEVSNVLRLLLRVSGVGLPDHWPSFKWPGEWSGMCAQRKGQPPTPQNLHAVTAAVLMAAPAAMTQCRNEDCLLAAVAYRSTRSSGHRLL